MTTPRTLARNRSAVLSLVVRLDFVVAVALTVIAPLILLVRAIQQRQRALVAALLAYWRVSSLLMIAVYLLISERPTAFLCGIAARLLIPWTVLRYSKTSDVWYERWRVLVTRYCLLGAALNVGTLRCIDRKQFSPLCRAYIEPAQQYGNLIHPNVRRETLGRIGEVGLGCYIVAALGMVGKRLRGRADRQL